MSGVLCSQHQREMYEDTRDGEPMARFLCPEPGCTSTPRRRDDHGGAGPGVV